MKCEKLNQFSEISPFNPTPLHHCFFYPCMSLHINMTEKCALLSKGFFPHCDTHLCIFCDLRPGNFLIVICHHHHSTSFYLTFIFYPPPCQIDFCSHYETRGLQQIITWWKKCAENVHTAKGTCHLSSSFFLNDMNFEVFITWSCAKFVENL